MTARARLIAAILAVLAPTTVLATWAGRDSAAGVKFDDSSIRNELAGRAVGAVDFWPPEVLEQIQPEKYLLRRYDAADGSALWAYVGFYKQLSQLGVGAHDPTLCYPAQGWEVMEVREARLPAGDGDSLTARLVRAYREGREEVVLYWIQPASRWPGSPASEQLLQVVDAITGRDRYAFVRLSMQSRRGFDPEPELRRFAEALAPRVRAAVQTAVSAGS